MNLKKRLDTIDDKLKINMTPEKAARKQELQMQIDEKRKKPLHLICLKINSISNGGDENDGPHDIPKNWENKGRT